MNKLTWLDAHLSLGCPGDRYLKTMAEKDMIKGLKALLPFPLEGVKIFCECYLNQSVQMKHMIPKVSGRQISKGTIEIAMDIFGPWPVLSIHGEAYSNIIKIKGKRHLSVYHMKRKDQIEEKMDQFLIDMEVHAAELGLQISLNLDLCSSDKDTNYFSNKMKEWCRKRGIKQHSSAPYAHPFNSAEPIMKLVKQGTLNNLHISGFPQMMWSFMQSHAVFCLNRQFTESCDDESLKYVVPHVRCFPGDEVDLALMLPIGCKIFVYIDSDTLAMNGNHAYIGYFAGYPYNMKGFNVYSPTRRNVYEVFHINANTRIFYKDEWGPHKKLKREVNNEIVLMSKEDAIAFDLMEDGPLRDYAEDFKMTEEGRLEAKSNFEQPMIQPNLSDVDPELNALMPNSPVVVLNSEADDPNFMTPFKMQTRVESNLFDEVISPDAQPVRKSTRIERISNKLGPSGFTHDQAVNALEGVAKKSKLSNCKIYVPEDVTKDRSFNSMSNCSMLMTMTALTMAIGAELSYPNKAVLAEFDVQSQLSMSLSSLSAKALFDVESYENPGSIEEAFSRPGVEGKMWYEQAVVEMDYLFNNVIKPIRRSTLFDPHILKAGWNCVAKWDGTGKLKKVRPRAFPKGCSQIPFAEFDPWKISSFTARKESIMAILFILVKFCWHIYLYDITKAFFSESLKERIISEVPPGFEDNKKYKPYGADTVWLYLMNAYGLKQASHDFGEGYADTFIAKGWKRLLSDVNVFIKRVGKLVCIFSLWVDDNFVIFSEPGAHKLFEDVLSDSKYQFTKERFEYALGMNVDWDREKNELSLSTDNFSARFFKMHNLEKLHPKSIPLPVGTAISRRDCPDLDKPDPELYSKFRSILGGLSHAANWVHREMAVAISALSKIMSNPSEGHMNLLLHLAGYFKSVAKKPLIMKGNKRLFLTDKIRFWGYCDSDFAGCVDTRRSTSGFCLYGDGNLLASYAGIQASVALSTCQAEWAALVAIITMILWFLNLFGELGFEVELPVLILCDSQSCIAIAKGAAQNFKRVKHFDIKELFLKEIIKKGDIDVVYVKSKDNVADLLTKFLPKATFVNLRDFIRGDILPVPDDMSNWSTTLKEMWSDSGALDYLDLE